MPARTRIYEVELDPVTAEYLETLANRLYTKPRDLLQLYVEERLETEGFKREVQRSLNSPRNDRRGFY